MVKVYRHAEKLRLDWDEDGVSDLVEAVARRVGIPSVFEDEELVRQLARQSGGCLRHVMEFVRYACEAAHATMPPK